MANVPITPFSDTAIIFDWDDTLLCSSWLASEGLRLDSPVEIPEEARAQLRVLESYVIKLLGRALELGEVHLVTNAENGWIELSARRFIPAVVPYLSCVKIISARSTYERMFPDQPHMWKVEAFRKQIGESMEAAKIRRPGVAAWNILSFGDSIHEREALYTVTQNVSNVQTKSVKFVERPTIEQLQRQLQVILSCFDYICGYGGNLDLMLTIQLLSKVYSPFEIISVQINEQNF